MSTTNHPITCHIYSPHSASLTITNPAHIYSPHSTGRQHGPQRWGRAVCRGARRSLEEARALHYTLMFGLIHERRSISSEGCSQLGATQPQNLVKFPFTLITTYRTMCLSDSHPYGVVATQPHHLSQPSLHLFTNSPLLPTLRVPPRGGRDTLASSDRTDYDY